jgi:hypothetical protein
MEAQDYSNFEMVEIRTKGQFGGWGSKTAFAYVAVSQHQIDAAIEGNGLNASQPYYWVCTLVENVPEGEDREPKVLYSVPLPIAVRGGVEVGQYGGQDWISGGQRNINRLIKVTRERGFIDAKGVMGGLIVNLSAQR